MINKTLLLKELSRRRDSWIRQYLILFMEEIVLVKTVPYQVVLMAEKRARSHD